MPVRGHPRILVTFAATVLAASVSVAYARQATDVPKPKPPQPPMQILQGCINGSIISSIQVDEQSSPMELPIGATLRVAGSKEMVRVLKTEHNGHLLELTGKMKGELRSADTRDHEGVREAVGRRWWRPIGGAEHARRAEHAQFRGAVVQIRRRLRRENVASVTLFTQRVEESEGSKRPGPCSPH